jgi:NAD(P)-dependent dehydrogenase (short-subunit alcohol dehydrogenase family)
MDLGIRGRKAIVTGGSRGIGRACAVELAREGVDVCIVGRDEQLLAEVAREVRALGVQALPVAADLSTSEGCKAAVAACVAAFGGVDILVNNAGAATMAPVLGLSIEAIDDALRLKTYGYLRMAQLCIPHMQANRWGRVVNIAGGAGTSPTAGNMPTSIANAGVLNITRALSDAVAKENILVNVICPGITNTDRARTLARGQAERRGVDVEEVVAEMGRSVPAQRVAEPEEVARVAVFLASEACSYVHGSSVYMDGGGRRGTP